MQSNLMLIETKYLYDKIELRNLRDLLLDLYKLDFSFCLVWLLELGLWFCQKETKKRDIIIRNHQARDGEEEQRS